MKLTCDPNCGIVNHEIKLTSVSIECPMGVSLLKCTLVIDKTEDHLSIPLSLEVLADLTAIIYRAASSYRR